MTEVLSLPPFISLTIGIIVYFIGAGMSVRFPLLRRFNIPDPVSGGILMSLAVFAVYTIWDIEVTFESNARDVLLVYFFTTIGLNARLQDLAKGGKPLFILLVLTIAYMFLQDLVALAGAIMLDLPRPMAVLLGTASLIGGHGTAGAWGPEIAANYGIPNALEIGIASATLGLISAALVGGPIAGYLIKRHSLTSNCDDTGLVGLPYETDVKTPNMNHVSFLSAIVVLNVAIMGGYLIHTALVEAGIKLPLFVPCMLVAILLTNTVPVMLPKLHWPARTPALAIIADISLSVFLAMSLMGLQLWTLAGLGGSILLILGAQTLMVVIFVIFILFRFMGRDYEAAVLSAGFGGFALGATPTAVANMTAVTKKHGPAPNAMLILPLVAAFFVDIANAFIIPLFLG